MQLTIGQCATLACWLELSAPKPGNVHRGADFEDTTFNDFAASAVALGPVLDGAAQSALEKYASQTGFVGEFPRYKARDHAGAE